MRILHLVHQFPPETQGGLESYVHDLAHQQAEAGHQVHVLSGTMEVTGRFEAAPDEAPINGVEVTRIHRADLFFDAWDKSLCPPVTQLVRAALESWKPDLVHIHHWIRLGKDLAETAVAAGIPVVVTLHDFAASCPRAFRMRHPDDAPCDRPVGPESCLECVPRWPWSGDEEVTVELRWFRRLSLSELAHANQILGASHSVLETVERGLSTQLDRKRVVPLAYKSRFAGQSAVTSPEGAPYVFAYWGSVTHRKGVELLVGAFRDLLQNRAPGAREARLLVFGQIDTPELEAKLRSEAEGLPVEFRGRFEYSDLTSTEIDAAVFPSLCLETYGFVLDEAFELGLPTVVPDAGALAERVADAGRRFKIQDRSSLTEALGALVDDPALHARLRAAVPHEITDAKQHLQAIDEIYRDAMAEGPLKPASDLLVSPEEKATHSFQRQEALFRRHLERPDLAP